MNTTTSDSPRALNVSRDCFQSPTLLSYYLWSGVSYGAEVYQTLEFVRTLIMTYVHKHCSTQTHTLRVSVEQAMRFAMTELKVETLKDKQKEAICAL